MTNVVTLGRLALGPPSAFTTEPVGDPVGSLGGAVAPAPRVAQQVVFDLNTILTGGSTTAQHQTIRRKLRSMLNNTPMKMQAFLYLVYSDDVEQNGWLVPAPAQITSPDNNAWKAVGLWQITGGQWYLAGRQRAMREARSVWLKDLRTNLSERDALGWIVSSDFSALPALPLTVLPHGASSVENTVNGQSPPTVAMTTGRDGGICELVAGPVLPPVAYTQTNLINPDLAVLSFERTEAQMNLSDVIVYDRRGQITAPAAGPDTSWEEVYGNDYPWSWTPAVNLAGADMPVLDNGLVRVRYDTANTDGFVVDVWTGAAYVEQGKMNVQRVGDSTNFDTTWVSASLVEWTPDRATILCVMSNASDSYSREKVYITVSRGSAGVTFEAYPALKSDGSAADVRLFWTPALSVGVPDFNESVVKIDNQGTPGLTWTPGAPTIPQNTGPSPGLIAATAGTGAGTGNSGLFPAGFTALGATNFTASENWVALLRCPTVFDGIGAYQTTFVLQQAANARADYTGGVANAYSVTTDSVRFSSQNSAGYLQVGVMFTATQAQQVLEAESMTLGSNTNNTVDAAASGGHAATATRTTDANAHVTAATWPNGFQGTYRVFIRAKVSANSASFYAKTGGTNGHTAYGDVTCNHTSYVWLDLGEIVATNTTLEIHAWMSGGAGTVSVDRMEAVLVDDQARSGAIYSGSRDFAQAALLDSRTVGALTTR